MTMSFKTADDCHAGLDSLYITETMGGILQGGKAFIWRVCVDEVAARMAGQWGSLLPVNVVVPQVASRKRELPPRWRLNARLSNWGPLKNENADGSHMGLIFYRDTIDDKPIDQIVADAVAQIRWRDVAKDWSW